MAHLGPHTPHGNAESQRAVLPLSSVQALLFSNEGATHFTPLQLNSCCAHPLTGHTGVPFPH